MKNRTFSLLLIILTLLIGLGLSLVRVHKLQGRIAAQEATITTLESQVADETKRADALQELIEELGLEEIPQPMLKLGGFDQPELSPVQGWQITPYLHEGRRSNKTLFVFLMIDGSIETVVLKNRIKELN